jgi:hypothetical protein
MKSIIIISCLVLAILAGWLFFHRSVPSAPHDISVSYLGLTNDTDIGVAAMFGVTNSSDHTVFYGVTSLDFKTPDGWSSTDPGPKGRFGSWIEPGKAHMFWRIPAPQSGRVWRLTLDCAEATKTPDGKLQGNGRHYTIISSEITP